MKKNIILGLIIFLAAFLRFYQLDVNPPSLTWDEVAWGYNAYSLGIDGKDEFGRVIPLNYLESFGDFKPPLYAYLDIIPIKIFGLNEFATRFPSAFFGTLTVLLVYFLTKSIFKNLSLRAKEFISITTSLLLAISPWHILLSRAAFEANIASFFIIMGVYLFLEAIYGKKWLLLLSVASFCLSFYTFNTARFMAPVLLITLSIVNYKMLINIKKQIILSIILGIIFMLPVLPFILSPQAKLRFQEVNIFTDIDVIKRTNQEIENDNSAWWSKIIHNRRIAYTYEFLNHYLDNLSPSFLFIKGDGNPKFSIQNVAQLYTFEIPLIISGIIFIFYKKPKNWWLVPFWLLVGIIPAATARETPHALRIETTLPMFQVISAYGFYNLSKLNFNKKILIKYFLFTIFIIFCSYNFFFFLEDYFNHYSVSYSRDWQYGYKQAVNYAKKFENKYNKIYLTKELGRPYIYYLFYAKYPPNKFRKNSNVQRDVFGFVTVKQVDKYYFIKDEIHPKKGERILYMDSPVDVPKDVSKLKSFKTLDGLDTIVAYEINY